MSEKGVERRLTTILAADVVAYSRLMAADEAGTLASLKALRRELIEPKTVDYRGRIVKLMGDGTLMEFGSVVDAVTFAVDVQRAVALRNTDVPEYQRITYRIGINIGDVIVEGDDIYGDGVNVAARLEELAETGGICVSRTVFDHVQGKVALGFDDLGEQEVKNIPKPVQVFRIVSEAPVADSGTSAVARAKHSIRWLMFAGVLTVLLVVAGTVLWQRSWAPREESVSVASMALPLSDKPSIAVLPFNNMSDDPKQEYFVDGMTEDLITDLSKIDSLFVIARNTVFTYKDKSVVVPDVARKLGVKFVLEGSVRRVGDRVRINTQLIDGANGAHIWADRYDGTLADIFALQDKVTNEIVKRLQITLTAVDRNRRNSSGSGTEIPTAHDAYLRGWQFYRRYTPEDFVKAIPHLKQAVELDPEYGRAWAALASVYWITYRKGFTWSLIVNPNTSNNTAWFGARVKAQAYLKQATRYPTPLAHQIESQISWEYRQFDRALTEARQAVALNKNDPAGHLAMALALIFAGRAEEAILSTETGILLDPNFPGNHLYARGVANLMLKRYSEAATTLQRALAFTSENKAILAPLSIAYAQTGRQEEAKAALKGYNDFWIFRAPKIETYLSWWPFRHEADVRLFGEGLIKAGLCCEDQLEAYIGKLRQGGTLE